MDEAVALKKKRGVDTSGFELADGPILDPDLLAQMTSQASVPEELVDGADVPVPESMDLERKRSMLLNDVPLRMKRTRLMDAPVGAGRLPDLAYYLLAQAQLQNSTTDSWLDEDDLKGVGALLGRRVKGARVHNEVRRRLYDHDRHKSKNRVTIMLVQGSAEPQMRDDEITRSHEKCDPWRGLTIFYEDLPSYDDTKVIYVDTPEGLLPVRANYGEIQDVEDVFETWREPH